MSGDGSADRAPAGPDVLEVDAVHASEQGPREVIVPAEADAGPVAQRRSWRWVRYALGALVVLALIVEVAAGHQQLLRAIEEISRPDWRWLTAALVVDVASMVAFAGMQLRLLRGAGVPVRRSTATSMAFAAHSLSITLPGGPVFSTAYNYRRMAALGAPRAVASWVIAVSATLSALALTAVGATAGLLAGTGGDLWRLAATGGLVTVIVLISTVVGSRPRWISLLIRSAAVVTARVLRRDTSSAAERLSATLHQLVSVRIPASAWVSASAAAVANWLLDAACLTFCMLAVGAEGIDVVAVLLAYTAGMAAASFPIVPAGLGVVDTTLTVALVAGGTAATEAVAAVVLFRVVSLGVVGGSGWALWTLDRARARRR